MAKLLTSSEDKKRALTGRSKHFAATMLLLSTGLLPAMEARASVVTIRQTLEGTYSYPQCTSNTVQNGCEGLFIKDETIAKLTSDELKANVKLVPADLKGSKDSYAEWDISVDNGGQVKTHSLLRVEADNLDDSITEIDLTATNQISFKDSVSTTDPNGKIFRFETIVTGNYFSDRLYAENIGDTPGLYPLIGGDGAIFDHSVELSSGIGANFHLDRDTYRFADPAGIQTIGILEDLFPASLTHRYLDIIYDGSDVDFIFDFSEQLRFALYNPDAENWVIAMGNDLMNTITTYASVFDANGNLLPDARVMSSDGFAYAPLTQYSDIGSVGGTVPVPGTLALFGLGLACLGWSRRKKA
jgi:hypothetical protein